jgi:hypothetical protein
LSYAARLEVCSCQAARTASGVQWSFFSTCRLGVVAGDEGADGIARVVDGLEDAAVHDPPELHPISLDSRLSDRRLAW